MALSHHGSITRPCYEVLFLKVNQTLKQNTQMKSLQEKALNKVYIQSYSCCKKRISHGIAQFQREESQSLEPQLQCDQWLVLLMCKLVFSESKWQPALWRHRSLKEHRVHFIRWAFASPPQSALQTGEPNMRYTSLHNSISFFILMLQGINSSSADLKGNLFLPSSLRPQ